MNEKKHIVQGVHGHVIVHTKVTVAPSDLIEPQVPAKFDLVDHYDKVEAVSFIRTDHNGVLTETRIGADDFKLVTKAIKEIQAAKYKAQIDDLPF